MRLRDEIIQLAHGKQTLGGHVGVAHSLDVASASPSINASRTLPYDVFQRYFSNLLTKRIGQWVAIAIVVRPGSD
jgi:hypothetical protein